MLDSALPLIMCQVDFVNLATTVRLVCKKWKSVADEFLNNNNNGGGGRAPLTLNGSSLFLSKYVAVDSFGDSPLTTALSRFSLQMLRQHKSLKERLVSMEPCPESKDVSPGCQMKKTDRSGCCIAAIVRGLLNISKHSCCNMDLLVQVVRSLHVEKVSYPYQERITKRGMVAQVRGEGHLEVRVLGMHVVSSETDSHIYYTGPTDYMYFSDTGSRKGMIQMEDGVKLKLDQYEVSPHRKFHLTTEGISSFPAEMYASKLGCTTEFYRLIIGALVLENLRLLCWSKDDFKKEEMSKREIQDLNSFPGSKAGSKDNSNQEEALLEFEMLRSLLKHTYGMDGIK